MDFDALQSLQVSMTTRPPIKNGSRDVNYSLDEFRTTEHNDYAWQPYARICSFCGKITPDLRSFGEDARRSKKNLSGIPMWAATHKKAWCPRHFQLLKIALREREFLK